MTEKVDFDKYTDNYNQLLREGTSFFSSSEQYFAKYKVDLVKKSTGHAVQRILEYGCGIGRNVAYLQAAFPGAEIIGTDISKASLEIARTENPGLRFEAEHSDLELGEFDLIFVAGVFHHIPPAERPGAVALLHARLRRGGSLSVFEHNPYNPVTRRIVDNCPYDADAILLKPTELSTLMQGAGMAVRSRGYCLFIPPWIPWLAPLENYLAWLPLGGQYWVRAGRA